MARAPKTCTALIIDTETTGLGADDEIIELGMVLFSYAVSSGDNIEVIDSYTGLRDPGKPISKSAQRVNGITDEMVAGATLDFARIAALLDRAERIYAHNASFDYRFATRLHPDFSGKPWICTMHGIPWLAEGAPSKKLGELVTHHGVANTANHRALDDAMALLSLIQQKGANGKPYIARLHRKSPYTPAEHRSPRQTNGPMTLTITLDDLARQDPTHTAGYKFASALARIFRIFTK